MRNEILIMLLPILGAFMDGFYDEGEKFFSSICKALFLADICFFLVFDATLWHIVLLILSWWVLFDIIYNVIRKLPPFYVGTTKWTDKLLRLIARGNAFHISWITKLMAAAGIFALFYTYKL